MNDNILINGEKNWGEYKAFLKERYNVDLNSVCIADYGIEGMGLRAETDIHDGDVVLKVPLESAYNVINIAKWWNGFTVCLLD